MNHSTLLEELQRRGIRVAVEDAELVLEGPDAALDDTLLAAVRAVKPELIAFLTTQGVHASTVPVSRVYPPSYTCEATLAQQRMLFMEDLANRSSYYNIPVVYRIKGTLCRRALSHALDNLVACHDVLRTTYKFEGLACTQQVNPPAPVALNEVDLSSRPDADAALASLLEQEANYPFDLSRDCPLRVCVITVRPGEYVLALNIHHIAADGWSANIIISHLSRAYRSFLADPEQPPADIPVRGYQYADYTAWLSAWLQSKASRDAQVFWGRTLQGTPTLHSLPTDFVRPAVQAVQGKRHVSTLGSVLSRQLEQAARGWQTTPFIVLQSVFAALLARYSGETDVVFGTAVANRQPAAFDETVGLFANTLVLRHQIDEDANLASMVKRAAHFMAEASRHQLLPFDTLVEELQPARSLSYNPLVQFMLVMQEQHPAVPAFDGADTELLPHRQQVSKFDLALHVYRVDGQFELQWEYQTALFLPETVAGMARHFEELLGSALAQPDAPVLAVAVALPGSPPLREPDRPLDSAALIHRVVQRRARGTPDAIAMIDGVRRISYRELDEWTDRVAAGLQARIDGESARIGVCMDRCADLIVSLLAIFKAGGTYVPLDPAYPRERLDFMVQDSGISILLVPEAGAFAAAVRTLTIAELKRCDQPLRALDQDPASPAYIIYTSGSTGKPKGVQVSHAALHLSLQANQRVLGIREDDVMPTLGSVAFGASLLEILLPLTSGGTVLILAKRQALDLDTLTALTDQVTVMHAVPSLLRQWLTVTRHRGDTAYPRLRLLLVGGEPVPETLLRAVLEWRPGLRLLELYGMTETAIVCSSYDGRATPAPYYCIGKPHANARFFVMSRFGYEQPVGVAGELYIGGASVADGYVGQPGMTAEKFVEHELCPGGRLYRTGDRVRQRHDGYYEFLGRTDHQVSLRGARIEMGEIEMVAASVAGVSQAIAHVLSLGSGEETLVLYYSGQTARQPAIREAFARQLPDFMRPSIIEHLHAFPLNANGKIDRKQLPEPRGSSEHAAPETEIEKRLLALWAEVLPQGISSVTVDFFEAGGHSLMASKLAVRIRTEFGIDFALANIFDASTVRTCAQRVEQAVRTQYANQPLQLDAGDVDELVI